MTRPCKLDTRWFKRELQPAQRTILLAAGMNDLTQGFEELLLIYRHLWAKGYRPGMPLQDIKVNKNR